MGRWFRLAWVLSLAVLFVSCAGLPLGGLAHQTIPSFALSPIQAFDAGSAATDYRDQSAVPVSLTAPSIVLTAMSVGAFIGSSSLHLSQNEDGSISVLSNGRSDSLLRGLDPLLVNPDLLPFLFPSCDVPAVLLGVTR